MEDDDVEEVEDDGELGSCGGMGRNCLVVQGSIEEKPCGCCVREILEGGGGGEGGGCCGVHFGVVWCGVVGSFGGSAVTRKSRKIDIICNR